MRKPFVAGNWKMHTVAAEARALASAIAKAAPKNGVDLALCPPYVHLRVVAEALEGSSVSLGAQNMHFEPKGAFTGEISAEMLIDAGCRWVILGHSERRHVFGESDELVARKTTAALAAGLHPILCVGETIEEREAEKTLEINERQIRASLEAVSAADMANVTVAYEPVWAIGTGRTATPAQAQEVHAAIRAVLAEMFGDAVAQATRIQYGGSVKPENAAEIFSQPDVDGGLIGGASLKADSFLAIAGAAL